MEMARVTDPSMFLTISHPILGNSKLILSPYTFLKSWKYPRYLSPLQTKAQYCCMTMFVLATPSTLLQQVEALALSLKTHHHHLYPPKHGNSNMLVFGMPRKGSKDVQGDPFTWHKIQTYYLMAKYLIILHRSLVLARTCI